MATIASTQAIRTMPVNNVSQRKIALVAGIGLLVMAGIAPFALFGVLRTLVVPADAAATFNNIAASQALFRTGIAAFLIVIVLDVVVAWALYILLSSVNQALAVLTAWLRLAFAAVFASALGSLLHAAELVAGAAESTLGANQLHEGVLSSIASFESSWTAVALAIFGVHLFGLGYLVLRSADFPKFLGVLVIVAGGGYLFDSFGSILVPDYTLSIGMFTFVGEALLIVWLFMRAVRGFPSESALAGAEVPTSHAAAAPAS